MNEDLFNNLCNSPTLRLFRDLNNSSVLGAFHNLQQSGVFDELTRVSQSQRALSEALASPSWLQIQDEVKTLPNVIPNTVTASINADLASYVSQIKIPILPEMDQLSEMTQAITEAFEPFQSDALQWTTRIQTQFELLKRPWALSGVEALSISGFAKMSFLSSRAQSASPFDKETAALFRDQLFDPVEELEGEPEEKDVFAVESGMNPELIAFFPSEYGHVLLAAGFSASFSQVRVPISEGRENAGEAYNPMHDVLLKQVEILLRELIEERLRSVSGDNWIKQRVPGDMKKKWKETQQQEYEATGKRFGLIHYADFMDLADLICRKNNWNEAFGCVFANSEDFRVSMSRLHPIRKSLAHARPLARSEVLVLVAEATRLLSVLNS